jgi:predicted ATPase|tara:strand:+ start:4138 stop:5310 length:1173 start_codon:yes stop_codon:yes gene_type:complete
MDRELDLQYLNLHVAERSILRSAFKDVENPPIKFPYSINFSSKGNIFIGANGRGKSVLLKHLASAPMGLEPEGVEFCEGPSAGNAIKCDWDNDREAHYPIFLANRRVLLFSSEERELFENKNVQNLNFAGHYKYKKDKSYYDFVEAQGSREISERQHSAIYDSSRSVWQKPFAVVSFLDMSQDNHKLDNTYGFGEGFLWKVKDDIDIEEFRYVPKLGIGLETVWDEEKHRGEYPKGPEIVRRSDNLKGKIAYFQPIKFFRQKVEYRGDEDLKKAAKIHERSILSHGQFNLRYLADYLDFLDTGEIKSNNGITLLDEVDSGLDTNGQQKMASILERMVSQANHQMFVSTHSPIVVNNLPKNWRIYDLNQSPVQIHERNDLTKSRIYGMMGF